MSDKTDVADADPESIKLLRYRRTDGSTEEESLTVVAFNTYFDFKDCFHKQAGNMEYVKDPSLMVFSVILNSLMMAYTKFSKKDLARLSAVHGVPLGSFTNAKKDVLKLRLEAHRCTVDCETTVYVFKSRTKPRQVFPSGFYSVLKGIAPDQTAKQTASPIPTSATSPSVVRDIMQETPEPENLNHLKVLDDGTKFNVIREWQARMNLEKIDPVVCAVCGSRVQKSKTYIVDGQKIDLTLLRNDELPPAVQPTSYNFIAYDRAILNAKGLITCNSHLMM
ncbi:hypothetical protein CVT26_003672 [Gymnopilus dilepis]|uniref:Uncharacterized protein n=1 Tax=Gymnopilus dilepis TaxID=231916 RepID=A0A409X9T4_9AGAR|nr:hypothetical protein CVT26_003672 [Gymnopilus dilepis]